MDAVDPQYISPCDTVLSRCRDALKPGKLLLDGPNRLTYGVFLERVARLEAYLDSLGLGIERRAVIISDDDAATIELFFGLISRGVTAVLLNPNASVSELKTLVAAAEASIAFVDAGRFPDLELADLLTDSRIVVPIAPTASTGKRLLARLTGGRGGQTDGPDCYPDLLAKHRPRPARGQPIPDSTTAYILFTSGTTSRPKGVEITHRNLFTQMHTFVTHYGLDASTRLLNLLPFHHTDGLTQGAVVSIFCGGTLCRPMRFRVDRLPLLLDQIYKMRITHFVTVPSMLTLIRQLGDEYRDSFDTEEFQFIISTAAYLDSKLWDELQQTLGVPIVNVYGLTETVCESCYCGPDAETFRLGTVGKPVDCEVKVIDAEGNALDAGQAGELLIRGDHVMKGYFRMPEETAAVLKDGWFHTGDIAEIDNDGFVSIVGRKKSLIISGGYNIYPEDVTNVLMRMDGIVDAVTLGIEDETWGEKVVACVIVSNDDAPTINQISEHFLRHASREKLPREIYIFDEFPRGPAGKVRLDALRKEIAARAAQPPATERRNGSLVETVTAIAARTFKVSPDELDRRATPETVSGWNSLAHVEFLMALEVEFGQRFTPRDIMSIGSLEQAISVLDAKLG